MVFAHLRDVAVLLAKPTVMFVILFLSHFDIRILQSNHLFLFGSQCLDFAAKWSADSDGDGQLASEAVERLFRNWIDLVECIPASGSDSPTENGFDSFGKSAHFCPTTPIPLIVGSSHELGKFHVRFTVGDVGLVIVLMKVTILLCSSPKNERCMVVGIEAIRTQMKWTNLVRL